MPQQKHDDPENECSRNVAEGTRLLCYQRLPGRQKLFHREDLRYHGQQSFLVSLWNANRSLLRDCWHSVLVSGLS